MKNTNLNLTGTFQAEKIRCFNKTCLLTMVEEKKTRRLRRLSLGGAPGDSLGSTQNFKVSPVSLWAPDKKLKVSASKGIYDIDVGKMLQ